MNGEEVWRFQTSGQVWSPPAVWNDVLYFGSWDCHFYAVDLEGNELWRFATNNLTPCKVKPAYEVFKIEISKSGNIEDGQMEDRYKSKTEESISLSDYHVTSEYATTSEYKQKSDYDTSFVIFECILENENLLLVQPKLANTFIPTNQKIT